MAMHVSESGRFVAPAMATSVREAEEKPHHLDLPAKILQWACSVQREALRYGMSSLRSPSHQPFDLWTVGESDLKLTQEA